MNIIAMDKGCYIGRNVQASHYEHIIASETLYSEGYNSQWHYHQNPHFSHILHGGSQEIYEKGAECQVQGTGLYYYPGIAHQNVCYKADTRIFNLEIDQAFFEKYQLSIPAEVWMFAKRPLINTSGLVKILKEFYYGDHQSELAVTQLTLELLAGADTAQEEHPDWARQIRTLLYDSWNTPLCLQDLARQLTIHPVTLSKYFSKYFHCTLGEYRRKIKVEKALTLIRQHRHSLTEIAYICAFSDQAHFTKTFWRITGFRPNQYRKL